MLWHVNRALRQRPRVEPVTMVCGAARRRRRSRSRSAVIRCRCSGATAAVERVGIPGLLLGVVDDYGDAAVATVALAAGETLLLFTDGVTDTPGAGDRFGEERLRAAVDAAPGDPAALLHAVSAALDAFAHGTGQDDRAMLALQRS